MSNKTISEENPRVLVIGDPHFRENDMLSAKEFVEKSLRVAKKNKPDFIVILGDTLDKHEVVIVQAHKEAVKWIDCLSQISPVFLLIGNHDLSSPKCFLSDDHVFTPLKKWKNVNVVDKPIVFECKDCSFVFCPYVENGRFEEALNTLIEQGETWEMADCIFSHQEFKGCDRGDGSDSLVSVNGDVWNKNYPPIINGHIHKQQIIENIFIPGSSYQHKFNEDANKCLWMVTFGKDADYGFSIEKIPLNMKEKKLVSLDIEELDNFDRRLIDEYHVKLELKGSPEQFKVFRSGKKYNALRKAGVKFSYQKNSSVEVDEKFNGGRTKIDNVSYLGMLKKVVETKNPLIKEMYVDIMGTSLQEEEPEEENVVCKLVFIENSDDEYYLESEEDSETE